MADIIVLTLVVAYCVFLIVRGYRKAKCSPSHGCPGGCAGCRGCANSYHSEIFKVKRS